MIYRTNISVFLLARIREALARFRVEPFDSTFQVQGSHLAAPEHLEQLPLDREFRASRNKESIASY